MFRTRKADGPRRAPSLSAARLGAPLRLFIMCAAAASPCVAQQPHGHDHGPAPPRAASPSSESPTRGPGRIEVGPARVPLSDVEVLDQDGRRLRFYSDLFKGRVVVVNTFFTSCTAVCPMQARALGRLQTALGSRFGREVFFVSLSRDPETDTPARLKLWAADYGVGPGWSLVTGGEGVMKKLLLDFTGAGPSQELHSPILLIGNDRTGAWEATDGLAKPAELLRVIDRVSGAHVGSRD